MLFLALFALFLSLFLFWLARRQQRASGLPAGRVIYVDHSKWGAVEQPLYDAELGLVGKPDYLVAQNQQIIPVEVKSSRVSAAPYDAHIFQLVAYCLLVERHFGKRPPYGILKYPNRTLAIDYTPELENRLLELLAQMRVQERRPETPRSHNSAARCSRCGYRNICDQRLL
jgi:CRISPR-associated exonuclease Cas4